MKKMTITALICALVFCAVCTACNNAAGGKPQQNPTESQKPSESPSPDLSIPKGIAEKKVSELPAEQQTEIKSLYGYYWADDGNKGECPAIDAERLALYTTMEFMSMGFTNLRWSRVSSSMWVCCSYAEDETDYDYENKRIIFTFVKDNNGTLKVFDTIVAMSRTYGPYIKGKKPDTIEKDGKTYYTYDKNDPKSPKLFEPTLK